MGSIQENAARVRGTRRQRKPAGGTREISVRRYQDELRAAVREAIAAGGTAGENRVQELVQKVRRGTPYRGAPVHFIGHLQTNKGSSGGGSCRPDL